MRPNKKILEFYNEQSKFGYIESLAMCKLIEAEEITINLRITFLATRILLEMGKFYRHQRVEAKRTRGTV